MIRTRKIKIADRIFTIRDLVRLANLLDVQASKKPKSAHTSHKVEFEDGVIFEGPASEVLSETELNRSSRPKEIEMWLFLGTYRESINISLKEGDSDFSNRITISASDAESADAIYTQLNDAIEKVKPQSFWGRKHDFLLFLFISIGVICLIDVTLRILAFVVSKSSPSLAQQLIYWSISNSGGFYVVVGGASVLGFIVQQWLLSAWPSVEFNFGSPHLRAESRRQRLMAVWTLILVPLILEVITEIVKGVLK